MQHMNMILVANDSDSGEESFDSGEEFHRPAYRVPIVDGDKNPSLFTLVKTIERS